MSCRKCTTWTNICICSKAGRTSIIVHCYCLVFKSQIISSISLFEIMEKLFECLETQNSILETRFSILKNRNSKLGPQNSILYSWNLRGSRIELRVKTVNLPLSGTVVVHSLGTLRTIVVTLSGHVALSGQWWHWADVFRWHLAATLELSGHQWCFADIMHILELNRLSGVNVQYFENYRSIIFEIL